MKNLLMILIIASNMNTFAMGGSLMKSVLKPFEKMATATKKAFAPSKSAVVVQYLEATNIHSLKINDQAIYSATSSSKELLESNYDKVSELELIGFDLKNTLIDLSNSHGITIGEMEMLAAKVEHFNFLLAHVTVASVKESDLESKKRILDVVGDIAKMEKIKGRLTQRAIEQLQLFQYTLTKSVQDISRSLK